MVGWGEPPQALAWRCSSHTDSLGGSLLHLAAPWVPGEVGEVWGKSRGSPEAGWLRPCVIRAPVQARGSLPGRSVRPRGAGRAPCPRGARVVLGGLEAARPAGRKGPLVSHPQLLRKGSEQKDIGGSRTLGRVTPLLSSVPMLSRCDVPPRLAQRPGSPGRLAVFGRKFKST